MRRGNSASTDPPKPHALLSFLECEAKNCQKGLQEIQEEATSSHAYQPMNFQ